MKRKTPQTRRSTRQYEDCFVGFFDVLGFSKLIESQPFDDVQSKIVQLLHLCNLARGFGGDPQSPDVRVSGERHSCIRSIAMSDSILLFTRDLSPKSFYYLLHVCHDLVRVGMSWLSPIRGAISSGKFFSDFESRMFFGPALVDAVRWEKSAQWAGVLLTPTCAKLVSKRRGFASVMGTHLTAQTERHDSTGKLLRATTLRAPLVVNYKVPLDKGTRKVMKCVNWPFPRECNPEFDLLERAFFWAENSRRIQVQEKYENTRRFHVYCDGLISERPI